MHFHEPSNKVQAFLRSSRDNDLVGPAKDAARCTQVVCDRFAKRKVSGWVGVVAYEPGECIQMLERKSPPEMPRKKARVRTADAKVEAQPLAGPLEEVGAFDGTILSGNRRRRGQDAIRCRNFRADKFAWQLIADECSKSRSGSDQTVLNHPLIREHDRSPGNFELCRQFPCRGER
jgi:hypothetical protein